MTYHSVIDYIRAGRACGLSDDNVTDRLIKSGWLEVDVKDAFELYGKLEKHPAGDDKKKEPEVCPPDQAEHAPTPRAIESLMSQKTPHMSAMRFTMWFVIIMVVFYSGYAIMQ